MGKIAPCVWHDGAAKDAARFHVTLLPDSRIEKVVSAPSANPGAAGGPIGRVQRGANCNP